MKRILHIIIITLFVSPCANSQNLSIHFEAHGESSTIDSIHITNITHNTSISIGGNDLLELVFPAQNRLMQQSDKSILVFPNPSSDICYLECKVLYPGEALISVFDITGKTIHQSTRELEKGIHQFSFNNLPAGLYQVSIQSAHYCYHAKMVSNSATHTGFSVDYLGFAPLCEPEQDLIAQKVLHEFVYSFGDILLFRAVSSEGYITINTLKIQASDTTDSIYEFNVDFGFMSCKDVDDKMYSIVKIGDRYWMAENLHSVRYSDSTDIIGIEDAGEWINTQAGAFSNYGNNETNSESFGRLYNWYAATNTRGICPTGWRMPTDDDFKEMERSLGMTHIQTDEVGWRGMAEGCYLKEHTGLTWSQTGDDINLSGFSALPAGMRNFTGSFFYETKNAVWWTASEANSLNAWCRALSNETCEIYRNDGRKIMGFSVRCMKDSLTTLPYNLATVNTGEVVNILTTSAYCGGEITDDGGDAVTQRGVLWSLTPDVSFQNMLGNTEDGTGTGSYTSFIEGLYPDSTYYVRAYAINAAGVAYGNEISFTTLAVLFMPGEGVFDIDGNFYESIIINDAEWTAKNLHTTTYSSGIEIFQITDDTEWNSTTEGAWCWYNNDSTAFDEKYGKLYNWLAIETGNLCPTGWHVATREEWDGLIEFLGGSDVAGGKLKDTNTDLLWYPANNGATNTSGISARAGGMRENTGSFVHLGMYAQMWSSTEVLVNNAYMLRIQAIDQNVPYWIPDKQSGGSVRCIKDPTGSPTVSTTEVSNITATSAKSGGDIVSNGNSIINRGVIWSATPGVTHSFYDGLTLDGAGSGPYTSYISGLLPLSTYFVRAYATTAIETIYGQEYEINTGDYLYMPGTGVIDIEGNEYASVIVGTQEWISENLRTTTYNDGSPLAKKLDATDWATDNTGAYTWYENDSTSYDETYAKLYNWHAVGTGKLCPVGWHIPSMSEWNTLCVNAGGIENAGKFLKSTETLQSGFGTWQEPNTEANNETGFTAHPGGYRQHDGNYISIDEWGYWWSSVEADTDSAYYLSLGYNIENAVISSYYKRRGYSVRCIKDMGTIPQVETTTPTNITTNSAVSGGTVTDDGGSAVYERGVVWATYQDPTLLMCDGHTEDGTGNGSFTSNISSLNSSTTYYVRAYATNIFGTSYGNEVSFTTGEFLFEPGSGVSDIDGRSYQTIIINGVEIMSENLKTANFKDGEPITEIIDDGQWNSAYQIPGYSYYNHDQVTYGDTYGKLYNFAAVEDGRLCPQGWHIISDDEFKLLEEFLGIPTNQLAYTSWRGPLAGGKLKEEGYEHWQEPNLDANNYSGFTALPCGYRHSNGSFSDINTGFYMWTSTSSSTYLAWMRALAYDRNTIYRSTEEKTSGYSVRCVKNEVVLAELLTYEPSDILPTSAVSGGYISNDGGGTMLICGVVWSTTTEPTIEANEGLSIDAPDAGEFSSTLTGLTPATTYYVRAYATNEAGTAYGEEFMFTTPVPFTCGDPLTFMYNGSEVTYGTVSFAGRCWLDRDLGASGLPSYPEDMIGYGDLFQWGREADGHQERTSLQTETLAPAGQQPGHNEYIYNFTDTYDWNVDETWIYRWVDEFGLRTAADPCPEGWKVPNETEWANALSVGAWVNSNDAFNSPLMISLGGDRSGFKGVYNEGTSATYWSSTGFGTGMASIVYLNPGSVGQANLDVSYGYSIRCIKIE